MTEGLHRFYGGNDLHFLTFSCYRRLPLFRNTAHCDLFLKILDRVRRRYRFVVLGYVVMPEHVHLLVSEPQRETLSTAIQALKLGVCAEYSVCECRGDASQVSQNRRDLGHPAFLMALRFILTGSGRRGFMISMFGRSASGLKSFVTSIAILLRAGWCLRLSSGDGAVFDGISAEKRVRCGSTIRISW